MDGGGLLLNRSDYVVKVGRWYLDAAGHGHSAGKYINTAKSVKGARTNCKISSRMPKDRWTTCMVFECDRHQAHPP